MMNRAAIPLALLLAAALAGCATTPRLAPQTGEDGTVEARLGQTANLGAPRVTPLKVLEDSRCPMEARCVWAGRVRISVRIRIGAGSYLRELASDQPLAISGGTLELAGVMPPRSTQTIIAPGDYRFALRFSGGL